MSFLEIAERVINEGTLQVAFLIDEGGNVQWSHGQWPDLNPMDVVTAWQSNTTAITIGDLRFSVIDKGDDRFVGKSIAGGGVLILAKCLSWPGYLIAWAPNDVDVTLAYAESARLANSVQS